jgi:hypothetical protein
VLHSKFAAGISYGDEESSSESEMKTLYDLLGALPHDDAEGLRSAFRKAVKGTHPDLRPGDPDAALKFRQIVHASEILADPEQRAAYDHLLELARLEQDSASARATAARIHKLASGTMVLAGASIVAIGGYLLFMHISVASMAPANQVDVTSRAAADIAPVSPLAPAEKTARTASFANHENASVPAAAIVSSVVTLQPNAENVPAANVGPPLDLTPINARPLRARGVPAYRNGDAGPITALDHAIEPDPKFSVAYIDRGTIFYRLRKLGRTFADITRPKRIAHGSDKASRSKPAPATPRKPRIDQAEIASSMAPPSYHRTAAQDPSREESVAAATLR